MTTDMRRATPQHPTEDQESIPLWVHGLFYALPIGFTYLASRSLGGRHFLACLGYLVAAMLSWKLAGWVWGLPAKALLWRVQREEAARQMNR